jgi:hypothetical protein
MTRQSVLEAISTESLTPVVRKATGDESMAVLNWDVQTLSTGGAYSRDGLLRVSGRGRGVDGEVSWEVVLKIVPDAPWEAGPNDLGYRRRESNAYGSGMLAGLPGPLRAPHCYGVTEHADGEWIWLELLRGRSGRDWGLADYVFAADQVGRFNAACANGPLIPEKPWMTKNHVRFWHGIVPVDQVWGDPCARKAFAAPVVREMEQMWEERERFYAAMERLPQVFSHYDYKSRNLFLHQGAAGAQEIVAVDWGDCGIGAMGGDLALLVSGSTYFLDWDPRHVAELDAAAYKAYVSALADAEWSGNEKPIRLSYLVWSAMYFGVALMGTASFVCQPQNSEFVESLFGCTADEYLRAIPPLAEFNCASAQEARLLMEELGF